MTNDSECLPKFCYIKQKNSEILSRLGALTSSHTGGKTLENKPLPHPLPLYPFEYVNSLFLYGTIGMSLDPNDGREREWARNCNTKNIFQWQNYGRKMWNFHNCLQLKENKDRFLYLLVLYRKTSALQVDECLKQNCVLTQHNHFSCSKT